MHALVDIVGVDDDTALCGIAERILEAVVDNNRYLLRRYPGRFPQLYDSGVRFRAEPWATPVVGSRLPPLEQFCPIPALITRGFGDCAQLCAWRVAELREQGEEDAQLHFYLRTIGEQWDPTRQRWYHVEVRRGARGSRAIEDPSRRLEF